MTGAPPPPVLPPDASPRALVLWVVNVINRHDADALRQVLGPDTRYRLPDRTRHGADEIVQHVAGLFTAFPDTTVTALAVATEEGPDVDTVFLRWRLTGTHTGGVYAGIEPRGARIDVDGIDHVSVRDRTVVSDVAIFDQLAVVRQLGLLPTEGSRVEVGLRSAVTALARWRGRG